MLRRSRPERLVGMASPEYMCARHVSLPRTAAQGAPWDALGTFGGASMEILVVVDGGLVETLQASPLLRSLAAGLDGVRLTVACPPGAAELIAHVPGVAEVLSLRALGPGTPRLGELARAFRALRRRRFHAAAVCCSQPAGKFLSTRASSGASSATFSSWSESRPSGQSL